MKNKNPPTPSTWLEPPIVSAGLQLSRFLFRTIRLWLANVGPMTRATLPRLSYTRPYKGGERARESERERERQKQHAASGMKSESENENDRKECHVFPQTCNQNASFASLFRPFVLENILDYRRYFYISYLKLSRLLLSLFSSSLLHSILFVLCS